jgi:hypothetical protein
MNFESKLKKMFEPINAAIQADSFLDNLHQVRNRQEIRLQRLKSGIITSTFVLILGIITLLKLDDNAAGLQKYNYELFQLGMTEESQAEFNDEMAFYLVNDSDDIWSTLSFFYESDYQPIISILENKL